MKSSIRLSVLSVALTVALTACQQSADWAGYAGRQSGLPRSCHGPPRRTADPGRAGTAAQRGCCSGGATFRIPS